MATALGAPNTKAISAQLTQIVNIPGLIQRFTILPKEESHTVEKQWSKSYLAGAVVLVVLSMAAYKKVSVYVGAGLFVAAAAVAYFKSKVPVEVPTEAYTKQCTAIKELFQGVAAEMRQTWQVESSVIAKDVNDKIGNGTIQNFDQAVTRSKEIQEGYLAGTKLFADPITKMTTEEQNPWRSSLQALHNNAATLATLTLDDHKEKLHPVVLQQLQKLQPEATRMVSGNYPAPLSFVDIRWVGEKADAKLIAQAWEAPALKV